MAVFNFTLLLCLVLAVDASSNPNTFGLHRRDHADRLGRLLKKRTPADTLGNMAAVQGQSSSAAQPSQVTSATAQTAPANSVTASASASVSPSAVSPILVPATHGLLKRRFPRALPRLVVVCWVLWWVGFCLLSQAPHHLAFPPLPPPH